MPHSGIKKILTARSRRDLDLKWALVGRIALVAILCAAGAAGYVMNEVAEKSEQRNIEVAQAVHKQLRLQLLRIDRAADLSARFPDWEMITRYSLHPGQCVRLIQANGGAAKSSCLGVDAHAVAAPDWFAKIYRMVFFTGSSVRLPLDHNSANRGVVEADINPDAVVGSAWDELKQLSAALWLLTVVLCVLVYGVVSHALRPADEILSGINRLAAGDLSYRLPSFRLRELRRISIVLNELADGLQEARRERSEFARKLIDAQESERSHLSLDLHDDVAQRLTAITLLARSIKEEAQAVAPSVAMESAELAAMASEAMRALRDTLANLRPPEIDDLGLRVALRELVTSHERQAKGRTHFAFQADEQLDLLPPEAAAHVYRIVQEGLTNVTRHAKARNVEISLKTFSSGDAADVQMTVADDGNGAPPEPQNRQRTGFGLLGMRERVRALSGEIVMEASPSGGFRLRVSFPTALVVREAP